MGSPKKTVHSQTSWGEKELQRVLPHPKQVLRMNLTAAWETRAVNSPRKCWLAQSGDGMMRAESIQGRRASSKRNTWKWKLQAAGGEHSAARARGWSHAQMSLQQHSPDSKWEDFLQWIVIKSHYSEIQHSENDPADWKWQFCLTLTLAVLGSSRSWDTGKTQLWWQCWVTRLGPVFNLIVQPGPLLWQLRAQSSCSVKGSQQAAQENGHQSNTYPDLKFTLLVSKPPSSSQASFSVPNPTIPAARQTHF